MVAITLPDGSVREFDAPVSGADVAADIGPGLAKAALAIRIDGEVRDLSSIIGEDAEIAYQSLDYFMIKELKLLFLHPTP